MTEIILTYLCLGLVEICRIRRCGGSEIAAEEEEVKDACFLIDEPSRKEFTVFT
jgi:hypothetical protein